LLLHGIDHEDAFPERVVKEAGPAVVGVLDLETIGVSLKHRVKGTGKFNSNASCHPATLGNHCLVSGFAPCPPCSRTM
jgi:hypothetical protein